MEPKKNRKVLLIGWDAADWKIIHPLVDSGQMPALARLIDNGVIGNIATLDPPLSPMLWTSIATGKTADKHGILGFLEPDPDTGKVRPVHGTSRKVKAFWNILSQKGFKTHVVGWWPSHPAEPINGVCVSNFFSSFSGSSDQPWPLAKGTVHPPELASLFQRFRVHPEEITLAHLRPFIPEMDTIGEEDSKAIHSISKILASCSSYHAATTWILENRAWDLCAVYLDAIDHFCHGFMKYHPPKMEEVKEEHYRNYRHVVSSAYRFHDMMLERLVQLAGDDTTVILLSDHGFRTGHQRLKGLPADPVAPALEHAPYGVLCMSGPGIRKDERIYGSTLLDIAPTILHLFGLPYGKDMDGKVLVQAFDSPEQVHTIESWEKEEGESGQHPKEMQEDPWAAQEAIRQLVELGYVEPLSGNDKENGERVAMETKYYLARVYMQTQRHRQAAALLEEITAVKPDAVRYALRLVKCYLTLKETEKARTMIARLRERQKDKLPQLDLLEGTLLFAEKKPVKALGFLRKAEASGSAEPGLYTAIGNVLLLSWNWKEAEAAFIRALSLDPEQAGAHHGLGLCLLRQERYEEAIDELLNAIGLRYHFPQAHYHLGEALFFTGEYQRAVEAFSVAVHMAPGNRKARQWLARLFTEQLPNPGAAAEQVKLMNEQIKGTITVVSGLPRSGTSMMMQMLKAGGIPVLSDQVRKEDEHNPAGYLELEKVKKIATDNSWLHEGVGKCVKIVAPLLVNLPPQFDYRIIFMQRDMDEVLRSQQVMLGKKDHNAYPLQLADAFSKQLDRSRAWIRSQPNTEVLFVNYADVVHAPEEEALGVAAFLERELDIKAMAGSVKKELYRNRSRQ
jgi:predicted AlkP superfamily phosphohydrolase/phosphomutase/tetratricopeptide (TPR) repeat protein